MDVIGHVWPRVSWLRMNAICRLRKRSHPSLLRSSSSSSQSIDSHRFTATFHSNTRTDPSCTKRNILLSFLLSSLNHRCLRVLRSSEFSFSRPAWSRVQWMLRFDLLLIYAASWRWYPLRRKSNGGLSFDIKLTFSNDGPKTPVRIIAHWEWSEWKLFVRDQSLYFYWRWSFSSYLELDS